MILLIDNYDSFVFNLARYFVRLGHEVEVVRNTAVGPEQVERLGPEAIVLSPGPRTPREAGCSLELVRRFHRTIPLLGVCLGHQAIVAAFGGQIVRAAAPLHGEASLVRHDGHGVFAGMPNPLRAGRYHSLAVDEASLPECLEVQARTADGQVMALRHREYPVVGMQFHPESVLTPDGYGLLAGFLREAALPVPAQLPCDEMVTAGPIS